MAEKKNRPGLGGRGLDSIFGTDVNQFLDDIQNNASEVPGRKEVEIKISEIRPNPYQPRKEFDQAALNELADSIRTHGIFTPLLVRKSVHGYDLITGERRLRAAKIAGLETVPAISVEFTDEQMMEISILENVQREDLNPIEEAAAYDSLVRKLGYTQEKLAERVGKTQPSIANKMRLLNLSESVQQAINNRRISERHGRAMLKLSEVQQSEVLTKIIDKNLTVAATEKLIEKILTEKKKSEPRKCFGVSTRIAVNTIRQSVKTLQDAGVIVETTETEDDENYTVTIRIKK